MTAFEQNSNYWDLPNIKFVLQTVSDDDQRPGRKLARILLDGGQWYCCLEANIAWTGGLSTSTNWKNLTNTNSNTKAPQVCRGDLDNIDPCG